ncbi:leucine-rich repeat extensin-like protein 6 [Punica granatum]|uniref:Cell wall hydroxyproline-rich glycoprotein n=2 Tax=Punica granatum TaxID=22663 RepID=A0A218W1E1_PUNGR|nr:leucine-rich repeat extensin-like protein 6 [Punica granatum]OWM66091.1 hypothetical protein CDL15_Pgr015518 [Punica granatum]PKI37071.1 hypothetical protein CRG98_042535 [Punica granatum]
MKKSCPLLLLLLLHIIFSPSLTAAVAGGFGVGIGIGGGGGGGVWIGGGINTPAAPPSSYKLDVAYKALQAWKSSITGDPHGLLRSWVGPNVCSYKGVFCSSAPEEEEEEEEQVGSSSSSSTSSRVSFVSGIDLNRANLEGTLVRDLAALTDLTLLHLNSNRFSGTIPITFRALASLQELDLSNNLLSGPFPSVILSMPSLVYLDLRFNDFSGPIPEDLFERPRLDAILLNNNRFQGEIPESMARSQASVVNLAYNELSGSIPAGLGFMGSKVREILFLNNRLTGCIPEGVGLFSEVEVFDVSYNSLTGQLPDTISCLDQIEVLNLAHNQLTGVLPNMICSLKSLLNLTVAYNFFSGFSQECSKLFDRNVGFDFSANCIPDRQLQRPPPECSAGSGTELSCTRIPAVQPLVCGAMAILGGTIGDLTSTSTPPSSPPP